MKHRLKNQDITIEVNELGAELTLLQSNKTGVNYLWNADPLYWKRSSPILFPIVGSLNNQQYTYEGNTYSMSQHGFARDMEFHVIKKSEDSIFFRLEANEETRKAYPFEFALEIGYGLEGSAVKVFWRVINLDDKTMYFSIGGHPAFMCPLVHQGDQTDYNIEFAGCETIECRKINENGLAIEGTETLALNKGILPITEHLFDEDALVIEGNQTGKVSLLNPDKKPYITVSFDAPLFGVWSPAKKNAPFICIEPWYGRCDKDNFEGSLSDREWGNTLLEGQTFEKFYSILVE